MPVSVTALLRGAVPAAGICSVSVRRPTGHG